MNKEKIFIILGVFIFFFVFIIGCIYGCCRGYNEYFLQKTKCPPVPTPLPSYLIEFNNKNKKYILSVVNAKNIFGWSSDLYVIFNPSPPPLQLTRDDIQSINNEKQFTITKPNKSSDLDLFDLSFEVWQRYCSSPSDCYWRMYKKYYTFEDFINGQSKDLLNSTLGLYIIRNYKNDKYLLTTYLGQVYWEKTNPSDMSIDNPSYLKRWTIVSTSPNKKCDYISDGNIMKDQTFYLSLASDHPDTKKYIRVNISTNSNKYNITYDIADEDNSPLEFLILKK